MPAQFLEHAFTQGIGIALAGLGKFDERGFTKMAGEHEQIAQAIERRAAAAHANATMLCMTKSFAMNVCGVESAKNMSPSFGWAHAD